jgi:hypothetical protein
MAALARKEQKQRQLDLELKTREAALEERAKKIAHLEELEKKLAAKDYSGVKDLIDYDAFTNSIIDAEEGETPEQKKLRELSAELSAVKTAQEQDVEKRFEAAVNERRQAVKALVAEKEDFSTIKERNAEEHVVQHILDTWDQDGVELTPEEAAKEVEEVLLEQAKSWSTVSKLRPKEEPKTDEKKELPPLKTTAAKTLTNQMQATGDIKRTARPLHGMTDAERYAEARRRVQERISKEATK